MATGTGLYEELLDRYGREIADAFLRAIQDLRRAADLQELITALEAHDLDAALEAVNIDPAAFGEMAETVERSYNETGRTAADAMPRRRPDGTALSVRFDGRNYRAERWIRNHSAELVTRVTEDQRQAVRASLQDAMEQGVNPRTAGLRIVGTIDRATGKREGGILGLTSQQEGYVRSARQELTSGDAAQLRAYLDRARRDKRFDRSILKAIREDKPVPAETVGKAAQAYSNRLLQLRGEMIGRTEALASLNAAQYEAIRQAVDSGQIAAADVRRVWRSAGDLRVRHTHMGLNADTVGLDEPFKSPSGALLMFPGDRSLGAPASEIIGCRCIAINRIDFLANIR